MEGLLSTPGSARVSKRRRSRGTRNRGPDFEVSRVSCEINVCEDFPTVLKGPVMALPVAGRLQFKHSRIESSASQELSVVALFGDTTIFQNHNSVCHPDCGKAM